MDNFDTLLWDVDQTLLDFKRSESYAIKHCFEQLGMKADEAAVTLYSGINERFWKKIETGEIEKKTALTERFETFFHTINVTGIDASAFQKSYAEALGSVYYYQDNSYELVKSLKGTCRQYLVTNGVTLTQRKKLALSGFDKLVENIFVSEEIGVPKPRKEFFDQCFARIPEFCRERTIIVGDSLTSDMQGANNAGIAACWYNPHRLKNNSAVKIDYEISNLNDIKNIL